MWSVEEGGEKTQSHSARVLIVWEVRDKAQDKIEKGCG